MGVRARRDADAWRPGGLNIRVTLGWAALLVGVSLSSNGPGACEKEGETAPGIFTSAVYESEAAMLKGEGGAPRTCMWKGRPKKLGKVICRGHLQLQCGKRGWYRTGPC